MSDLLDRVVKTAHISVCEQYRYCLTRYWGPGAFLPFVMLNPSTADSEMDDPTIRRCMSFARREGAGGIMVVNLYAFRATDPKHLLTTEDPVGPLNSGAIYNAARASIIGNRPIICAWGINDVTQAAAGALAVARSEGARLMCLGKTKHGHPRHPLYIKGDHPLEAYP